VTADSLFEAAALGLEAFNGITLTESRPGLATTLEVAVQPPHVIHRVRIQQLRDWLKGYLPPFRFQNVIPGERPFRFNFTRSHVQSLLSVLHAIAPDKGNIRRSTEKVERTETPRPASYMKARLHCASAKP